MKILFLSHINIFPAISGDRLRISQQLRRLALHHEVDTVEISHIKNARPASDFIPEIKQSHIFYIPPIKRYVRASATLFNTLPECVNHYYHPKVAHYIDSVIGQYDLVFCGSMVMSRYVLKHTTLKRVVDFTDSFSMNYANIAATIKPPKSWLYSINARRMKKYEILCRQTFNSVIYISRADLDYIDYHPENAYVIPNSVEIPDPSDCNTYKNHPPTLCFVGMMRYRPNIQAAEFLAKKIMPDLKKQFPDIKLILAGGNPPAEVTGLANDSITVTGFLESLTPVYRDCTIFVAPMLSGSGVQNKILQAMAHGCCVVTTPLGAEGIGCGSNELCIAEPDAFADTIARLLANPKRMQEIGSAARRFIITNLSETSVADRISAQIIAS